MNRRDLLAFVTGAGAGLAGCSGRRSADDPSETATEATSTTATTTGTDPTPGQVERGPGALVELYDLAADIHRQNVEEYDVAQARYETGEYVIAATGFAAAREGFANANRALVRVTNRLAETSGGGFRIADAARIRTERLQRAALDYQRAAVATLDGEETTAETLREDAESSRVRADNESFADTGAFESDLAASL